MQNANALHKVLFDYLLLQQSLVGTIRLCRLERRTRKPSTKQTVNRTKIGNVIGTGVISASQRAII